MVRGLLVRSRGRELLLTTGNHSRDTPDSGINNSRNCLLRCGPITPQMIELEKNACPFGQVKWADCVLQCNRSVSVTSEERASNRKGGGDLRCAYLGDVSQSPVHDGNLHKHGPDASDNLAPECDPGRHLHVVCQLEVRAVSLSLA